MRSGFDDERFSVGPRMWKIRHVQLVSLVVVLALRSVHLCEA